MSHNDHPAITELRDLRAVQGAHGVGVQPLYQLFPGPLVADAEAFSRAGWVFLPASDTAHLRERVARVFTDRGQRLLLFDGAITIRFHKHLSREEIDQVLRPLGLEIVRRVPVAPNVFRVRSARDPLHLSEDPIRDTQHLPGVVYSEPSYIESIPHR